ncbi:MAG: 30S ribosomal protein S3 [Anaerolineae bacterium]|jgi:small subunit ribosomal protein S3|nr:30S ribosomal protein S3 [Anaerolineae bacterium]
MGRKVHPVGFRLKITQPWKARWFAKGSQYRDLLQQDIAIRSLLTGVAAKGGSPTFRKVTELRKGLAESVLTQRAGVSGIEIERFPGKIKVSVHTAKPGVLIGRKGESVKKIRSALEELVGQKVDLDVKEIKSPDTDAHLIAVNIADQLTRRIAYRRAMQRAMQNAMRQGAEGVKIEVSGRLSGAEMARRVWMRDGRVPLQTLRADIDFSVSKAVTAYGTVGVKVWVYKGEKLPQVEEKAEETKGVYVSK